VTKDEFGSLIAPFVRHGLTVAAGFLAARGLTGGSDMIDSLTAASVVLIATLAWSFLEKHKLISDAVSALPLSALEQVANNVSTLRAQGADPLLIAHIAQGVLAIAQQELAVARPDLVPQPQTPVAAVPVTTTAAVVAEPVAPPSHQEVVTPAPAAASPLPAVEQVEPAPVLADGSVPA